MMSELSLEVGSPELTPETFVNRELSTIDFQRRVLSLAQDSTLPLLERIKFLAIVGNNMDEFYMVRVGSHRQKLELGISSIRPDGYTTTQLLQTIHEQALELIQEQRRVLRDLFKLLEEKNIYILSVDELDHEQRYALRSYFDDEVFPLLTPLAVDHARPFPHISNLSLNLGIYLQREWSDDDNLEFARIKVPPDLPRLVNLKNVIRKYMRYEPDGERFVWIEDVILDNLPRLFPGMVIYEAYPFRVIRNADIDYEHEWEDELQDVKSLIEQLTRDRRFGSVVRLSVPENISQQMLAHLIKQLKVNSDRDVYMINGALGSADLMELINVDRPDLKYPSYVPRLPEILLADSDIFRLIQAQDIVFHHPYDSFVPVEDFFRAAARDPDVLAIKATLYRVGKNSPIVDALMEARDNGKQVTVLVELKARFDEENNLERVRAMERKGVHVIYGVEELPVKTHAKVTLVVRREAGALRQYVHLSTGNYNSSTARLYTDIGLLTANREIAEDVTRLFNRLTGYAPSTAYSRLLVAPEFLLDAFIDLIHNEIAAAQEGRLARLIFKMNQLEEDLLIRKLYEASQAGVQVDLIVRGLCCLRPGVPGVSDNIRVISIVGRFLEHSRIYYFRNAPEDQQLYVGSADLMRRNLYNRVEVVFPILDPRVQRRIKRLLNTDLQDNSNAWQLYPDGVYRKIGRESNEPVVNSQAMFMEDSFGISVSLE